MALRFPKEILEDKLREEVLACSSIFSDYIGVKLKKAPKVEMIYRGPSNFNSGKNRIQIQMLDFSFGRVYFEEVGHMFRNQIRGVKHMIPRFGRRWMRDIVSDEFLGKVAGNIGRLMVKETEYAYLGIPNGGDWSEASQLTRAYGERVKLFNHYFAFLKSLAISRKEHYQKAQRLKEDLEEVVEKFRRGIIFRGKGSFEQINSEEEYKEACRIIVYQYIEDSLDLGKYSEKTDEDLQEFAKEISIYLKSAAELSQSDEHSKFMGSNMLRIPTGMMGIVETSENEALRKLPEEAKREMQSLGDHLLGYCAADVYMNGNGYDRSTVRKMFRMSDQGIKKDYILIPRVRERFNQIVKELDLGSEALSRYLRRSGIDMEF
ncbi:MAG: hypothetical protein ABIE22_05040 [archaeon]